LPISFSEIKIMALQPKYLPLSAWMGHGPFAIWLVAKFKPSVIVELGSHSGYSYFSMCQAIAKHALPTKIYGVDTWQGDEHAGFYDDSVYKDVVARNEKYKSFGTLLRKRFDQALADIPDCSVDLLHVDGRHLYDDVKEDFETWIPKLSDKAIVLFHDTVVMERDFGVHQYWGELLEKNAGFNFLHSNGLGVLFYGAHQSDFAKDLIAQTSSPAGLQDLRDVFVKRAQTTEFRYKLTKVKKKLRKFFGL
jgi:hypothetical protein